VFAGKVVNHAFAKELLMGFVGGEVDKLLVALNTVEEELY
jgi:Protein of unknown function (DUF3759)